MCSSASSATSRSSMHARPTRFRTAGRDWAGTRTSGRDVMAGGSPCPPTSPAAETESDMNFGIHIGHMGGPLAEMRKLWKFAEAKGFDWFSVADHFQESPPRTGDMDTYESVTILTAAAMDTERIRLGSGVFCVAYRNP